MNKYMGFSMKGEVIISGIYAFWVIYRNNVKYLDVRIFQNFSFWKINLKFNGKTGLWTVFPKPFPKLTEFWKRLVID